MERRIDDDKKKKNKEKIKKTKTKRNKEKETKKHKKQAKKQKHWSNLPHRQQECDAPHSLLAASSRAIWQCCGREQSLEEAPCHERVTSFEEMLPFSVSEKGNV
jgi:hypothetical protein